MAGMIVGIILIIISLSLIPEEGWLVLITVGIGILTFIAGYRARRKGKSEVKSDDNKSTTTTA